MHKKPKEQKVEFFWKFIGRAKNVHRLSQRYMYMWAGVFNSVQGYINFKALDS